MNKTKHIPHVGLCSFTSTRLFALKVFKHLHKSYLRSTVGHMKLTSIGIINIEKSYANCIFQRPMDRIIDTFEKRKKTFETLVPLTESVHVLIIL